MICHRKRDAIIAGDPGMQHPMNIDCEGPACPLWVPEVKGEMPATRKERPFLRENGWGDELPPTGRGVCADNRDAVPWEVSP